MAVWCADLLLNIAHIRRSANLICRRWFGSLMVSGIIQMTERMISLVLREILNNLEENY